MKTTITFISLSPLLVCLAAPAPKQQRAAGPGLADRFAQLATNGNGVLDGDELSQRPALVRLLLDGFSLGGYGAARPGFKDPEMFRTVSIVGAGPMQEELVQAPRAGRQRAAEVLSKVRGGEAVDGVIRGDVNDDAAIDVQDWTLFAVLLAGPGVDPGCEPRVIGRTDLDVDGDIDLVDSAAFQCRVGQER